MYKDCFKVTPMNIKINVRHYLYALNDVLCVGLIDYANTQETKLDDSFPQCQLEMLVLQGLLSKAQITKEHV